MSALRRVVFFGSPEFALPTLAALCSSPYRPILVVSQPARRAGRGKRLQEPPVAEWARREGLEVSQPERVRSPEFLAELSSLQPDAAVVVAFGQIFPQSLLDIPTQGCVNLHGSLLPRYRGAAPIQAAIAAGESGTGVTTMRMEAGLDTGPIYLQESLPIGDGESAPELSVRMAELGAALMIETLQGLESGDLQPREQDDAAATLAPRLTREDGYVEWTRDPDEIWRRSLALRPWPGLTALCSDRPLKLLEVEPAVTGTREVAGTPEIAEVEPGTFLGVEGRSVLVAAGGGCLALLRVQRPGRRELSGADFVNGEDLTVGAVEFTSLGRGDG